MATFAKRGSKYRAQVTLDGRRESATFSTKGEAQAWAKEKEAGRLPSALASTPVRKILQRYAAEVAPKKRGFQWELLRINAWCKQAWVNTPIAAFDRVAIASWRDQRLKSVSPGTVLREMGLLAAVLEVARRDWGHIEANPIKDVRRPTAPADRRRRVTDSEIEALQICLDYAPGQVPTSKSQLIAVMMLLAIETGMRSGELCGLTWPHVHATHVHLPRTKNGTARDVALTPQAQKLLATIPRTGPDVFGITASQRDGLFRKARDRSGVTDLHFHDFRSEAIFRLSKRLNVLELARQVGHNDIRSLNFYYNVTGAELAAKLA